MGDLPEDVDEGGQSLISTILGSDEWLEVQLTRDKEVSHFHNIDIRGISSRVKPDVSVYNKSKHVFVAFIEVESESLRSTIRKLYFVLLLHLIKVRTYDKGISTVTGVVLPKGYKKTGCTAVTVTWDILLFRFEVIKQVKYR